MTPIQQAISILGGPSATARLLDVSPQAVCFWRDGERAVSAEFCMKLERLTDRRITCEQLLPRAEWYVVRNKPRKAARRVRQKNI